MIYKIIQTIFWPPFFILAKIILRIKVINKKKIDLKNIKGPIIVASNHKSRIDPLLIGLAFPLFNKIYPIRFMTADGYLKIPILGQFIKLMGGFPVFKKQGIEKSLKLPLEILASGGAIGIFPEGKMVKDENSESGAKIGVAVLALKSQSPILPIAIKIKPLLKYEIIVGEPFTMQNLIDKNIDVNSYDEMKDLSQIVMKKIAALYY
ncbi:MAG: lysophospholipid acyltransferase family protein [Patescibacteria group bacterium]